MSASTTAFILERNKKEGYASWNDGEEWTNFTGEEIRKFENECESKFNTEGEVKACVAEKIKGRAQSSGKVNWGSVANNAIDFFNQYRDNKNATDSGSTPYIEPEKKSNGLLIGISVVGGLALLGTGIWYLGFRNKGK